MLFRTGFETFECNGVILVYWFSLCSRWMVNLVNLVNAPVWICKRFANLVNVCVSNRVRVVFDLFKPNIQVRDSWTQYLIYLESWFEAFECNGVKHIKWLFHMSQMGFVIRSNGTRKRTYIFTHPYNHKKCRTFSCPALQS